MEPSPEAEEAIAKGEEENGEEDVAEPEAKMLPPGEGRRNLYLDGIWLGYLARAVDDAVACDDLGLHRHGEGRREVVQFVVEESAAYGGMALGDGGAEGGGSVRDGDHDALGRQGDENGVRHEYGVGMYVGRGAVACFDDDGACGATGREGTENEQQDDASGPTKQISQATALWVLRE